jgi:cytochrome b561
MSEVSRYHPVLVVFHWLLAFLIISALALGALIMVKIPNTDPTKIEALRSHMVGGSLILALMLLRLFVRVRTTHPDVANAGNPFLNVIAWVSHRALYVLVLAQAGSGLLMAVQTHLPQIVFLHQGTLPADLWVFPVRSVHYVISRTLMALIALHVAGALYHIFVRRDGLLRRMWFGRRIISASNQVSASTAPTSMVRL